MTQTYNYLVPIEEALHYPIFAGQTVYAFDGNAWVPYYEGADVTPQGSFARIESNSPTLVAEPDDTPLIFVGEHHPWPPPKVQLNETIAQYAARLAALAA
jgi:hypothetical protein